MTARPVHPRSLAQHELIAGEVLTRYARASGWCPALPVPVEQIIERCYNLRIAWEPLPEKEDERILGALDPAKKTLYMNETHAEALLSYVGPRNFTFGHELGHWIYDAMSPDQGSLLANDQPVFCRGASSLDRQAKLREVNANKFASCLLLPRDLVLGGLPEDRSPNALRRCANAWGVSLQTLEIRIGELGTPRDVDHLSL